MENKNISDLIEMYLKDILKTHKQIEIRRSEMADLFNCVPSQINYVINTRFTLPKGYRVESKRGGGGYIRIVKINLDKHADYLASLQKIIGNELTDSEAFAILEKLYENKIITRREGHLLVTLFSRKSIAGGNENHIRANMMHELLKRLGYEDKE
ncbi:CtsR family transcriptional regulator [Vagococcus acidifermentans]|uniref:Transcriptional regulator CtsR n=1 Tax=Vagococcus acidifermentans TaxID=564710 RepID=A0A430AT59_9ENTE|nr:CtsR family transcriptional regulator [Vagococcus acidifermentans]RSU11240.1 CtsR family transcriptional regulator [Vagococcus acidifermentans]